MASRKPNSLLRRLMCCSRVGSLGKLSVAVAIAMLVTSGGLAQAQSQAVSRAYVIETVLARGPRSAIARADSASAGARVALSRQFSNPSFAAGYTQSLPRQHVSMDIPFEFPWIRGAGVRSATAGLAAAQQRYRFERALIAFAADTLYTRALAQAQQSAISRRTTGDADSLVVLARLRRDAGEGSELDVQVAMVNAGALANQSARDSLNAVLALLSLQQLIGLGPDSVSIVLSDSLLAVGGDATNGGEGRAEQQSEGRPPESTGTLLLVAAAEADLRAAEFALTAERRRLVAAPALSLGFDTHDPSGSEPGILPMIGLSLPLPLFNRNRASIAAAQADRDRAMAAFTAAQREGATQLSNARRELSLARARVSRSQGLLDAANRVATLSLLAYREGASPLPNVLASQRTARESLAQYVEDVAALRNAAAVVRLLSLTVNQLSP